MPKRQRPIPTEAQIVAAAKELGYLDDDGNYPREMRRKLATYVDALGEEAAAETEAAARTTGFADEIADIYRSLANIDLPEFVIGEVTARIAPAVYNRTASPRGNRTP